MPAEMKRSAEPARVSTTARARAHPRWRRGRAPRDRPARPPRRGPSQMRSSAKRMRERVDRAAARDPQRAVRREGIEAAEAAPRALASRAASCTRRPPARSRAGSGASRRSQAPGSRSADRAPRRRAGRSSPLRRHLAQARDELVDRRRCPRRPRRGGAPRPRPPPPRGRRRRACRGPCAARPRGSCARPTRCARRARARSPASRSARDDLVARTSSWRSAIGSTIAWTGASQSGNSPA